VLTSFGGCGEEMEAKFSEQLLSLPSEGIRIKKFRKSLFDYFLKINAHFDEEAAKEEFQAILDDYVTREEVTIENGFIQKIAKKVSSKKRGRSEEEHSEVKNEPKNEMTPFETAILCLLNELPTEGIRLKKFRQTILDQFATTADLSSLKEQFASGFEKLCQAGHAQEENGMVTRIGDKIAMKKMKSSLPIVNQEVAKKEMWKYGEQVWADGSLDQDYLVNNPDGITRLFCGNLKKTITEEQLHNAINGIVFIKWMTDKTTREFYGSTFLEMKDPAAAAAAVLLDKTKLLGRSVGSPYLVQYLF
jgi:hypothetical protein